VASVEFLGHVVLAQGARPITSYVEAVERRPCPTAIKKLQDFLGLVNFYRRFLPSVAAKLLPLTDAGFMAAKAALSKATWLGHPDPTVRLALHVDASSSHIRAALHQWLKSHSTWQPLGFFSHKLEAVQAKWSVFDRELFACVEGIQHFRFILEGRAFTIYTDHKPLVGALAQVSGPWTACQCRHLAYLAEFTSDIQQVAGHINVAVDAMSRPLVTSPSSRSPCATVVADLCGIAARQPACPSMLQASYSLSLRVNTCEVKGVRLLCDTSTRCMRPLVPHDDCQVVFETSTTWQTLVFMLQEGWCQHDSFGRR
jgi:cleavage and polyadenylation specificity factor subunit 1